MGTLCSTNIHGLWENIHRQVTTPLLLSDLKDIGREVLRAEPWEPTGGVLPTERGDVLGFLEKGKQVNTGEQN